MLGPIGGRVKGKVVIIAEPNKGPSRRLAAILFTDMVGFTAKAQRDERRALQQLQRHNDLLRRVFSKHQGRVVKTMGDAFLVEFDGALQVQSEDSEKPKDH